MICKLAGRLLLAGYDSASPELDFYELTPCSPRLDPAGSVHVGTDWDLLAFVVVANVTYANLYQAKNGYFAFLSVSADLKTTARFNYNRSHAPATTQGFTTIKPFVLAGGIVILAYSIDSGPMSMYTLTSLAMSETDVARLQDRVAGGFQWAKGCARLALWIEESHEPIDSYRTRVAAPA